MIYLIGSLRNPQIPLIANQLREVVKEEVFDDWYSPGKTTDTDWQMYEKIRGRNYKEALAGYHATEVFLFDNFHLHRARGAILVLPAGRSGHLELGRMAGQGKPTWILSDKEPKRYDVMNQFASEGIHFSPEALIQSLKTYPWPKHNYEPKIHLADAMWLVGILEGEGTFVCDSLKRAFRPRPRIALQMTDRDVVERVANLLESKLWGPYIKPSPRKPVWACAVTGLKAAEWMRILKPYFSSRRQNRIEEILNKWNPYFYRLWGRS